MIIINKKMSKMSTWAAIAMLLGSGSCSTRADESWDNTLASCQDFASKFSNTCVRVAPAAFADLETATVTCTNDVG